MSSSVLSNTSKGVIGAGLIARRDPFVVGRVAAVAPARDFNGVEPVRNATGCDGGGGGGRSGVGGAWTPGGRFESLRLGHGVGAMIQNQ
jgi:hypothetical protein